MKKVILIAIAVFGLVNAATVQAAPPYLTDPVNGFGVGSTNVPGALPWAIVGARSANGGAPAVYHINAGSDATLASLRFYRVVSQTEAKFATNATTTISVASTNTPGTSSGWGWNAGTIIIRHMLDDTYEKRTLTTATGNTNIVTTAAPSTTVPGDIIYLVVTNATMGLTATGAVGTNSVNGGGGPIYVGQKGKPLMVEVNGTSAAVINSIGGLYLP